MNTTEMIINFIVKNNPNAQRAWEQAQKMLSGKDKAEQAEYVTRLLEARGVTREGLQRIASQIGINLK